MRADTGLGASMKTTFVVVSLALVAGCASSKSGKTPPAAAAAAPAQPQASLYTRLGGKPAITAVVNEFVDRVAADKRINMRFLNTDIPHLRELLVEFVCTATGGPEKYTGRDMHASHGGMQLVDEEFNALVEDLSGALDKFKVPEREKGELLGALGPLKPQIVNPPSAAEAKHDPALVHEGQPGGRVPAQERQDQAGRHARDGDHGARARAAQLRRAALQRHRAAARTGRAGVARSAVPRGRAAARDQQAEDDAEGYAAAAEGLGRQLRRGRARRQAQARLADAAS